LNIELAFITHCRTDLFFMIQFLLFLVFAEKVRKDNFDGCELAPQCLSRNRKNCVSPEGTCGICLEGFTSDVDVGNEVCVSLQIPEDWKFEINIVDFGLYEENLDQLAEDLKTSLSKTGFALLVNHGIDEGLIESIFISARKFFSMPLEWKMKQGLWDDPESNTGYVLLGQEGLHEDGGMGDEKEAFDTNLKEIEKSKFWNQTRLAEYWHEVSLLEFKLLKVLSRSLSLPDDWLEKTHDELYMNDLRLLHYPPTEQIRDRAGAHSDYGTMTLLLQDSLGGLEVLDRVTQTWVPVNPVPNSIVFNTADFLERWTNHRFPSTMHKVANSRHGHRYSIPYFVNPNRNIMIDSKDMFPDEERLYPPVNCHKYLTQRLVATYDYEGDCEKQEL